MKSLCRAVFFIMFAILASTPNLLAQIIHGNFTNSKVSYLDVTESGPNIPPGIFVPPSPSTTANPDSTLSFAPNNFIQTDQTLAFDLKTKQSQLQINMKAAAGRWFDGTNALQLETAGSYNLVAPFTNSQAFSSSTAAYTLIVNEVDNAPFSSGSTLTNTVVITPSSLSLIGPGGSGSGNWSGKVTLDINTIKTAFGIGGTNKVTGMLLQYSAQVAAAGVFGSATTSLMNLNVVNATVPEPSTYALLVLAASGLGVYALRRRGR
jgi:hypothetical protein